MEIRERVKTIQTIALLRSAKILRMVLETCGDLLSLRHQWKISKRLCEKLSNNNNNNKAINWRDSRRVDLDMITKGNSLLKNSNS